MHMRNTLPAPERERLLNVCEVLLVHALFTSCCRHRSYKITFQKKICTFSPNSMPNFTCQVETSRLRHQWEAQPVFSAHAIVWNNLPKTLWSCFSLLRPFSSSHTVRTNFFSCDPQTFSKDPVKRRASMNGLNRNSSSPPHINTWKCACAESEN